MNAPSTPNLSAFIWNIANLLRGTYKQADYGKVILPFTVLRQVEGILDLDLGPEKKECIRSLGYGTNVKVMYGFREREQITNLVVKHESPRRGMPRTWWSEGTSPT